jgi:hypothetical protein
VLRRREATRFSSLSDDEVGGYKARSARSERSERSNQTQQLSTPTAVDSGQQFIDDLCCDLFVVKVWARYIPPPHGTVESDQPRDAVPPKVARPKVA